MPMSPRLLRPRASGVASGHPEALAWRNRVLANGGSVSDATLAAVTTFCASIDAESGLRAAILRCNLFCGNSDANLAAVRTPLYLSGSLGGTAIGNAMDTNVNFAQADYQETGSSGGLKGNGTTKYLNTGFNYSSISNANSFHLSTSGIELETTGERMLIGSYQFPGNQSEWAMLDASTGASARGFRHGLGSGLSVTASTGSEPHLLGSRTSSSLATLYRTGASAATQTASLSPVTAARAFFVFAGGNNGTPASYTAARLRMYSIGNGLTAAQTLAFSNAVVAFNTALGRA